MSTISHCRCLLVMADIPSLNELPLQRLSTDLLNTIAHAPLHRRQQYLTGRFLLAELLYSQLGIEQLPAITTSANGRPAFLDPNLPDFNISHSGDRIIVTLAIGCQIGCDLEQLRLRPKLMALAKYSFSDIEYQWLAQCAPMEQNQGFWQLWTLRESILKLAGKGVWQMKELSINPLTHSIIADFCPELYSLSTQHRDTFWAITTTQLIAPTQLTLQVFDWSSHTFLTEELPLLTTYSSCL